MDCLWLLLPFFLSTELDELQALRGQVASLNRDVAALEVIVINLDGYRMRVFKVGHQLVKLWEDTEADRPFLSPNGPPNVGGSNLYNVQVCANYNFYLKEYS